MNRTRPAVILTSVVVAGLALASPASARPASPADTGSGGGHRPGATAATAPMLHGFPRCIVTAAQAHHYRAARTAPGQTCTVALRPVAAPSWVQSYTTAAFLRYAPSWVPRSWQPDSVVLDSRGRLVAFIVTRP